MTEQRDGVDWAGLKHAYGLADDVPQLLRAMEDLDEDVRAEALDGLGSSLCHQETVYSGTAPAVPRLGRLAVHGPGHRKEVLWLLVAIAGGNGRRVDTEAVRRAIAEVLPSLLGLVTDEDPGVRQSMVWLIASCGEGALPLMPLLRARLATERSADVRADVVTALGLLDVSEPTRTERGRALLSAPEPEVRLAAATDLLRTADVPFPAHVVECALEAYDAQRHVTLHRGPWPERYRPLDQRLLDDPDAALSAVARGMPLAQSITDTWRDRERDVLPWLVKEAEHAHQLYAIARAGAALEDGDPAPWLVPFLEAPDAGVRVAAVVAAVRFRVPDAIGRVLSLLDELPEDPGTAQAVRAAVEVFGEEARPVAARIAERPRGAWTGVLAHFPDLAARCLGELVGCVPDSASALAALGPDAGPSAERALLDAARQGSAAAAFAYAQVSGDHSVAVEHIRAGLDGDSWRWWLRDAGRLGSAGTELVPQLGRRLSSPSRDTRAAAAAAIWRITGRTTDALAALSDQLACSESFYEPQMESLRALTEMGRLPRQARPVVERLAWSPRRVAAAGLFDDGTPHPDDEARVLAKKLLAAAADHVRAEAE
ncbi:hypothetical protein [Streptomyces sp. NPDC002133]|uniref:hypothetical protein n=1 Tax=Streptomyces sp. NPDC002133 TaxID=3154409 RepID=UPI003321F112